MKRDYSNAMIGGVCAGLANYLTIDVTLVRLGFVGSVVFFGVGILPYVILWIVMPAE